MGARRVTWIGFLAGCSGAAHPAPVVDTDHSTLTIPGAVALEARASQRYVDVGRASVVAIELTLRGAGLPAPRGLIVLMDRSGSMSEFGIDEERASVAKLLAWATGRHVSVISYGTTCRLNLSATDPGGAAITAALAAIVADGSTNLGCALELSATEIAHHGPSDVLVFTDGSPNEGEYDLHVLAARAGELAAAGGTVSVIAVGADVDPEAFVPIVHSGRGTLERADRHTDTSAKLIAMASHSAAGGPSSTELRWLPAAGARVLGIYGAPSRPIERSSWAIDVTASPMFHAWIEVEVAPDHPGGVPLGTIAFSYAYGATPARVARDGELRLDAPVPAPLPATTLHPEIKDSLDRAKLPR